MTLERFLRWDIDVAASPYAGVLHCRAEQRLSAALAVVLEQSAQMGEMLIALVSELPEPSVLRVAAAPELEFQLRLSRTEAEGSGSLARFLASAFRRELEITAAADEPGLKAQFDFDGPYNRGDAANRFPNYCPIPPADRQALRNQAAQATEMLERGAPRAACFTRTFTTVIVPISVPNLDARYGSFSSSWYPGRTVLVNPASPQFTTPRFAAALLHEAIHSLIDVSEIGFCLIADGAQGGVKVASPWTGSQISVQSLLDAYFVWYGLLWFWLSARDCGVLPRKEAVPLIAECERGFRPSFEEVTGANLPSVHETCRAAIESLRSAVVAESAMASVR